MNGGTYIAHSGFLKRFVLMLRPTAVSAHVLGFHSSPSQYLDFEPDKPYTTKKWPKYNEIVYPPKKDGELTRPAEICHQRTLIKYSQEKMWYIGMMLRGLTIDEGIKQMTFYKRKGGAIVKEILLEAQKMAIEEHNVEYKSNLWIADAFPTRGYTIKGLRKHRGPRFGVIHYRYCHFFVRLIEGHPPKHYMAPEETGNEKMTEYIENLRKRKIWHGL